MLKRHLPLAHPGEILREDYINEYHLTITEVTEGVEPQRQKTTDSSKVLISLPYGKEKYKARGQPVR